MDLCPCGSKLSYAQCCQPYIKGSALAPTAEALMRSRYTAYVKQDLDYIQATHKREENEEEMSMEATRKWAEESTWLGLEILETHAGQASDTKGTVEFKALYEQSGMKYTHHETGSFEKIEGKWLFCDGKIRQTTDVRATPKIGRNDPCSCGSGKKYKKCCG